MSRRLLAIVLAAAVILAALSDSASAYIRLRPCGTTVEWASGAWPLSYTLCNQDTAGNSVSTASKTALRLAFAAWDGLAGTAVAFSENTSFASQGYSDLNSLSSHLVIFDADNTYFSSGSSAVAVTSVYFPHDGSGCPTSATIQDADILINSSEFTFTTGATAGVGQTVDLQNVITHEIGHFIGLDHQPVPSATMTALTSYREISKRSLSQDDISGAAEIRPSGSSYGTVSGTINRPGGSAADFPYVVALDSNGNVISGNLGSSAGVFSFYCPAGTGITVYATPYRGTMGSEISLSGTASSDFSMSFYSNNDSPASNTVTGSANLALGTLTTNAIIGSSGTFFAYPFTAVQVTRGSSSAVSINKATASDALTGLSLELSNPGSPDLTASSVTVGASSASFSAAAASNASLGARDLRLANSDVPKKKTVSIGAIEIIDAAPTATSLDVTSGSGDGGTSVVISGTGFQGTTSTLKVLFGDTPGTVTNVASTAVTATSPAHAAGAVTVGVINADGQGANAATQFTFNVSIASVTPASVCYSSLHKITLSGGGFEDGMTVAVNGTDCTDVVVVSDSSATAKLPKLDPGTYSIVVTKLDASTATLTNGIVFSTSCGGGGGGCFGSLHPQPRPPADHLGLLLPFAVLFFVLYRLSRPQDTKHREVRS